PEIALAVHHRGVEAAAHGGGTGDRIGAGGLADVDLDVDHGFRAVAGGRDAWVLELLLAAFLERLRCAGDFSYSRNTHLCPRNGGSVSEATLRRSSRGGRNAAFSLLPMMTLNLRSVKE